MARKIDCVGAIVLLALCGSPELKAQQASGAVEIAPAIELKYTSANDSVARLLGSDNLNDWSEVSREFTAKAKSQTVFLPSAQKAKFYRVETFPVDDLAGMLETVRATHGVPAMSAVVVLSNRVVGLGAVGVKKFGTTEPVTIDDKWHIGSCTKSVTALLAAMFVEEGLIEWSSTLGEIFPEYRAGMHPQWRDVPLEWLVQNRAGAPGAVDPILWNAMWNFPGSPKQARVHMLTNITQVAPNPTPGTTYVYSNTGFAMAGAMLEKVANGEWENLVRERIFKPLGMTSSGFGVPATPRYLDEPWGHTLQGNVMTPVQPGIGADNPTGNAPAGAMHASLMDLAKYTMLHLEGAKRQTELLRAEGFLKLHTPPAGQGYAMGWNVAARDWAGGKALNHAGSNTQWYTLIWMAPERGFAVVANANFGGNSAAVATDAVVGAAIQKYLP